MNQTGVVYCRDSDELTSQHASQSATIIAEKTVVLTETTELSHISSSGRVKRQYRLNLIEGGTNNSTVSNIMRITTKWYLTMYFQREIQ